MARPDGLRPGRSLLGRQLVLGRGRLQVFEPKLHLIEQPRLVLRARPIEFAPQLLDPKLQMGNQRFAAGKIRLSIGRFGLGSRRMSLGSRCIGLGQEARSALRPDHRVSGGKIGWQRFKFRGHSATESYSSKTAKQNRHPTEVGRQVSCGWRQSIPDSRYPS